ncbi:FxsA family protein [bacterium]|nr:FxsA family protein [bacterium]
MFTWIVIIPLICIALLDLFILIQISTGGGIYLIIISQLFSGFFGLYKLRKMDFNLLFFFDAELKKGAKLVRELWEEVLVLIALCFLIFPGFLTDFIGGVVLIPYIRNAFMEILDEII